MANYAKLQSIGAGEIEKSKDDGTSNILKLQSEEQKNKIIKSTSLCIIDIYADWCEPCKLIEPKFAQLANKHNRPGVCMLVKENFDDNIKPYKGTPSITGVPTFLVYVDGVCKHHECIVGADMSLVENLISRLNK